MTRTLVLGLGVLAIVAALAVGLATFDRTSDSASAATGGPEMVLTIKGGGCDDPTRPTSCDVPTGGTFTLSVDALGIPAGGYTLMQTAIDLGAKLIYNEDPVPSNDIIWTDAEPAVTTRAFLGDVLVHGSLTGLFPPLPISTYVGNLVEISLTCPAGLVSDSPAPLALLPYGHPDAGTSGAAFIEGGTGTRIVPKVSSLTITCLPPTPTPTNTPTNTNTPTFTATNTRTPTPTSTPCPGGVCPTPTPTATATPIPQPDFVVDTASDGSDYNPGDGQCSTAAFQGACSLRAAVQESNALFGAQRIFVPSGPVYGLTLGELDITSDMIIQGQSASSTIIDGNRSDQVIDVGPDNEVAISDVTIRHGLAQNGGGVVVEGSVLTLDRVIVTENEAVLRGGGIYTTQGASLVVNESTISANVAWIGGGIQTNMLIMTSTTVSGNTSGTDGGGISGGPLFIHNSTISDNEASLTGEGGGIKILASAQITNSTIADNYGGGLGIWNQTIANNTTVKNTIIANNDSQLINQIGETNCFPKSPTSLGNNLSEDSSCGFTTTGDLQDTNPLLSPLANHGGFAKTHALTAGSPAIDAGSSDCLFPETDQRGLYRPIDGDGDLVPICDIGAFEFCAASGCAPSLPPKIPNADTDGDLVQNSDDLDDDNDGCFDTKELGTEVALGGLRNPHNRWDFYDVLGFAGAPPDSVIDLGNDILGVILHYSPNGYAPGAPAVVGSGVYDDFDRGPSPGPNPWNMTAPDGFIDLANDILGVILQYGHDCR